MIGRMSCWTVLLAASLLCRSLAWADGAPPCAKDAGKKRAAELVRACLAVTAATHPPCNAANECSLILQEIRRNCSDTDERDAVCSRDGASLKKRASKLLQEWVDAQNRHDAKKYLALYDPLTCQG